MPLRGACGRPVQAGIGRSAKPFTRRTNKVTSPFTRRTTSACGKVPLPNAHANAPTGGVRATSTGKASGGRQSHLCGAQIRPHRYLRGAQQARSAPRTAARWRCRVRTPMPLRGACGLPVQASLGRSAKPFTQYSQVAIYAAHNKRGQRRERRQGGAAGCARQCPFGGRAGNQYRQSIGRSAKPFTQYSRPSGHLRGAQQARSAPRTNVRALLAPASNEER